MTNKEISEFIKENKDKFLCLKKDLTPIKIIGYHKGFYDVICSAFVPKKYDNTLDKKTFKEYIQESLLPNSDIEMFCTNEEEIFIEDENHNTILCRKSIDEIFTNPFIFLNKYYISFFDFFQKNCTLTKEGKIFDLTKYIDIKDNDERFSVVIEQENIQENLDCFYLCVIVGEEKTLGIFESKDIHDIFNDVINFKNYHELVALTQIIKSKDIFILQEFIKDKENLNCIKSSLAYRFIGLQQNNLIETEEFKSLDNLFKKCNEKVFLNEKGEIKYKKFI